MKSKPEWVNVRWIQKLTGWNKNDLRAARRDGTVETSYDPVNGLKYNVNSIPECLLINKNAAELDTRTA